MPIPAPYRRRCPEPPSPGVVSASPAFTACPSATAQAGHPATRNVTSAPGCTTSHGKEPCRRGCRIFPQRTPSVPPSPPAAPMPFVSLRRPDSFTTGANVPMPAPDLTAASQAVGPQPGTLAPPLPPDPALAVEGAETPGAMSRASQIETHPHHVWRAWQLPCWPKGFGVIGSFTRGDLRSRRPRRSRCKRQPATAPPAPTAVAPPTPSPAEAAEQPAPPVSAAPVVAKKTSGHKPKQAILPQPSARAPAPPPAQPEPATVTPPPSPSPPTPSPEDIAKAEAAKLANIPRIVQVLCNYGLKEATFTVSSGGQTLFEETFKGKRKKEGFLGIKGSYQGTFTHTITVPAGASEVSVHVVAREGATNLSKPIKMPPPGGFVPTLAVEVDSDHLSLNWQSPSAAK